MTATYAVHEAVATITLDDGKVNALSPAMQAAINTAFDQAAADVAAGTVKAVVLAGNGRVFSAGFELSVFASGDADAGYGMLRGGFELALRVLTFPAPVVMASTGPAIAMGSFLMLTGDHRVGSVKSRFQANEVAIGMVIPQAALEIMRARLTPPAYSRAVSVAAVFAGDAAIDAGWADEIVEHDTVLTRAQEIGAEYAATLNLKAHLASKLKARQIAIDAIQAGIDGLAEEYKKSTS
ncbi:crotonase/enoyl-CoA hydratase family protein [Mycolicibacterium sp. A43C]